MTMPAPDTALGEDAEVTEEARREAQAAYIAALSKIVGAVGLAAFCSKL